MAGKKLHKDNRHLSSLHGCLHLVAANFEPVDLLTLTSSGLYCKAGDFYLDPWKPVVRAVITHGHSDHARAGHKAYLTHRETAAIIRHRLGINSGISSLEYGKVIRLGPVKVSLYPAGHIPGSSQILLEHRGDRWVFSGDYHTSGFSGSHGFCTPFESVPCRVFVTESTFGLPVYRWPNPSSEFDAIQRWWADNQKSGRCSVLVGYSLGKAQRLLHGLDPVQGPLFAHGAVRNMTDVIRKLGYELPDLLSPEDLVNRKVLQQGLVLVPPSAIDSPWMKRFEPFSLAFASGWMRIRGPRRRHAADRGFVLSDHADWDGLNAAVDASGAERVLVTHGFADTFSRWLKEKGLDAEPLQTLFEGESGEIREGSLPEDDPLTEPIPDPRLSKEPTPGEKGKGKRPS